MNTYTLPPELAATTGNVAPQLNAWLSTIPDQSLIQLAGATLQIDQTIVLTNRANLLIDGQGATLHTSDPTGDGSTLGAPSKAARTRAHVRLIGGHDIIIHDLTIQGANPHAGTTEPAYVAPLEAQHGIDIHGTTLLEVYNLIVTDVYGDFLYFGMAPDGTWSSGHVHDCVLRRNGRQGISLTAARDVRIDHNVISDTRRATFDLEPNTPTWGVEHVQITDNTIGAGRLAFIASGGQGLVNDVAVLRNTLTRSLQMQVGTGVQRRSKWTICQNVARGGWGTTGPAGLLKFSNMDDVAVVSNVGPIQANRGVSGVELLDCAGAVVFWNAFPGAYTATWQAGSTTNVAEHSNQLTAGGPFDQPTG